MTEQSPPVAGDPAIMADYFDVMRRFLETQERVMGLFLAEPAGVRLGSRHGRRLPALTMATDAPTPAAGRSQPAGMAVITTTAPPVQPKLNGGYNGGGANGAPAENRANGVNGAHAETGAMRSATNGAMGANGVNGTSSANGTSDSRGANGLAAREDTPAAPLLADAAAPREAFLDRKGLTDLLLTVVEEKTGYPRDMVGLDQNLESDLGIDSIKRIEVVGTMLQQLPQSYRSALGDDRSLLNTQATLNGVLNVLSGLSDGGGAARPFDFAGAGSTAVIDSRPSRQSPRYVIVGHEEQIDEDALRRLDTGRYLITDDTRGVAPALAKLLAARGCTPVRIAHDVVGDGEALGRWLASFGEGAEPLAGVIHLAAIDATWLDSDATLDAWRAELERNEKSLFVLARELSGAMRDGGQVVSVSALGGFFGRVPGAPRGLSLQGGAVGMLKSLFEERGALRLKAIDVDQALQPGDIASILLGEMELMGGRQEVGYPHGHRTVFSTIPTPVEPERAKPELLAPGVILATGGGRGVTAEVLRQLARPGATLVLTGRRPLPENEPEALKELATADALRGHFIAQVRAGLATLTPSDIGREVQKILAGRELRANIEDFRQGGAAVEYHALDVTDEAAMRELLDSLYARHGNIDGVLHGAGVIEDKLLADKTSESWSRVVDTKVLGLLLLQRYLRPESLRFLTVFSSVAGRYGNSGQSDYATANELMNRLCCQLRDHWKGQVKVKALCWGPWGPTKFGTGMVSAETEAKFAAKGVKLVSADEGRQLFEYEIACGDPAEVEIVCGEGPWEEREAANGRITKADPPPQRILAPLLGAGVLSTLPRGEQVIDFRIDAGHAYLQHHRIDAVPVLPAAAAMEMMAEAAGALWSGWQVVEVRNGRLLKGVEVRHPELALAVVVTPPTYGGSDGFDVDAVLQSKGANGKIIVHYRAVLRLQQQLPSSYAQASISHSEKKLGVAAAYDDWLFHGPRFQVIEHIDGLSASGARAVVKATRPSQWLLGVSSTHGAWLFDPAVVDAAPQMAILWARAFRGKTALPTRFGRIVRFRERLPERMHMSFEHVESADTDMFLANVYYTDAAGELVLLIEEMESVASTALNRLGGTAAVAAGIPA